MNLELTEGRERARMKLTALNGEWLEFAWGVLADRYQPGQRLLTGAAPTRGEAQLRMDALADLVSRIDPDILFLCEAPKDEANTLDFADTVLPDYALVTRSPGDAYNIRGNQWLWFLVKKPLADRINPRLLPISTWRAFAAASSPSIRDNGKWNVAIPKLTEVDGVPEVPVTRREEHSHYRHPQTLRFDFGGSVHEVIGCHLKSKFVSRQPRRRRDDEAFADYAKLKRVKRYLAESHRARVKLTSEAMNVRAYIDQRFEQEADPSIFVVGDINDGPGKELMEREYLLHDMISNLQGEVFFAHRFLNHALFDQPQSLRWTVKFKDRIDPQRDPKILLDHILFTQALTRGGTGPLVVPANGGRVEHLAAEETAARYGRPAISDHRPISIRLDPRQT
ncbi:MAG: endonuclease/exonuclease/phosphatase family protein [Myxococcota bacterium]